VDDDELMTGAIGDGKAKALSPRICLHDQQRFVPKQVGGRLTAILTFALQKV
jgi:hypothetical protein